MDLEIVGVLAVLTLAYSTFAVFILRATPIIGLRPWSFVGFLVICYLAAFIYGLVCVTLFVPSGEEPHSYWTRGGLFVAPPAAAWAFLRVAVAIGRPPRWVAAIVIAALATGASCVYASIIRYRDVDTVEYISQKGFVPVQDDRSIDWLIRRAQIDYWIAPTPWPGRCTLMYSAAFRRADELHLIFWAPRASNNKVIYAFSYGTHEPLWKTQIGTED